MFGHHHESAQATVLYAEMVFNSVEATYEFVLEVHPPGGQAFRAKATHHFVHFTPYPQVGDVVYVKYDPKSLEVQLDVNDDNRYGEKGLKRQRDVEHEAAQAQRDALLAAPPGTPVSSANAPGSGGVNHVDPALQELLHQEEAERQAAQAGGQPWPSFEQVQDARVPQMPGGFGGAVSLSEAQASWLEARALQGELMRTGASGQAKVVRKQQTGEPIHHLTPFFVEVLVQPDHLGSPFQSSFTAWVDQSLSTLREGSTLPVKYDPQNPSRMVFVLPA